MAYRCNHSHRQWDCQPCIEATRERREATERLADLEGVRGAGALRRRYQGQLTRAQRVLQVHEERIKPKPDRYPRRSSRRSVWA